MENLIKVILGGMLVAGTVFVFVLLIPLVGAFAGWVMGWVFPETIDAFLAWTGLDVAPWQLGLLL